MTVEQRLAKVIFVGAVAPASLDNPAQQAR